MPASSTSTRPPTEHSHAATTGIAPTLLRLPDLDASPPEDAAAKVPTTAAFTAATPPATLVGTTALMSNSMATATVGSPPANGQATNLPSAGADLASSSRSEIRPASVDVTSEPVVTTTATVTPEGTWMEVIASRSTLMVLLALIAGYAIFGPRGGEFEDGSHSDPSQMNVGLATVEPASKSLAAAPKPKPMTESSPAPREATIAASATVAAAPPRPAPAADDSAGKAASVAAVAQQNAMPALSENYNAKPNVANPPVDFSFATEASAQLAGADLRPPTSVTIANREPTETPFSGPMITDPSVADSKVTESNGTPAGMFEATTTESITEAKPAIETPIAVPPPAPNQPTRSRTPRAISDWKQYLPPLMSAGAMTPPVDQRSASVEPAFPTPPATPSYIQTDSPGEPDFQFAMPGAASGTPASTAPPAIVPEARVATPNPTRSFR